MSEQPSLVPVELHEPPVLVGRYLVHRQIARGGMATVHIGRLVGDQGFDRLVAIKRLLPEFTEDEEFVAMFLDEARVASKVKHRNVVPVLDVVASDEEVMLVQEYVHGAPLNWLLKSAQAAGNYIPLEIAVAIACQILSGLQAAHETVDELGTRLEIVHRDVSPQNVLIATDGSAKLLDFGVAKAAMAAHVTREGTYKGKLAYSAPEQLRGAATRQSDLYSLSVVLWEMIVGHRMHRAGKTSAELLASVMNGDIPSIRDALGVRLFESTSDGARTPQRVEALERVVERGLALDLQARWATAADMEEALRDVLQPASASAIAAWLRVVGKTFIARRERVIAAEENGWRKQKPALEARSSTMPPEPSSRFGRLPERTSASLVAASPSAPPTAPPVARLRRVLATALLLLLALTVGFAIGGRSLRAHPSSVGLPIERAAASEPAPTTQPLALPLVSALPARSEPTVEIVREPTAPARAEAREQAVAPTKRQEQRARVVRPPPAPAPTPVPAASASPKPADDCSTPYYFDGTKKIFKVACL